VSEQGDSERYWRYCKTDRNDEELRCDCSARDTSYALYLVETAKELGLDPTRDLPLKTGCFGAEPWSHNTCSILEREFGVEAYESYGLSELIG
jgi:phenylacetate-coenzyme A ligase PaaK-like adenylate-forming protein